MGDESEVRHKLTEYVTSESIDSLLEHMNEIKPLLGTDEKFTVEYSFPELPQGSMGLMVGKTDYFINIKSISLVILALLLDLTLTSGCAAAILGMSGIKLRAITRLDKVNGEKCMVVESMKSPDKTVSYDRLRLNAKKCPNQLLKCKFCIQGKCKIRPNQFNDLMKSLCERNVFASSEGSFILLK
jgi:hypothetical protein